MKFMIIAAATFLLACSPERATPTPPPSRPPTENPNHEPPTDHSTMKLTINNISFAVSIERNATTEALLEMLPMTIKMNEINGNEKYYYLPHNLPTSAVNVRKIERGDLMLYGSSTLVLFYESFQTAYSYTKIGRINNVENLASAVGAGSVEIKFEL